jgi:4-amino-4-deoxy-L-arabinose transferase-like glycosyltransferase
LIVIGWLGLGWWKHPPPDYLWTYDEPVYLSIAYDILHFGRFTEGSAWSAPSVDPARPPGMARAPLYPFFLAATAALDPAFNKTLSCHVEHAASLACPQRAPLPRILQFLMMAAFYLLLWRIATRASGSRRIGWLSLGLALIVAPILIRSVNMLMTEAITLFFTTTATWAAVAAVKARRGFGWALVSGAMLALAGMTRPPFVYLFPAVIAGAMPLIIGRPQ